MKYLIVSVLAFFTVKMSAEAGEIHMRAEATIAGFEKRVDDMFRAESGKPLKRAEKNPPLAPGRGNYVRGYSYSMVAYEVNSALSAYRPPAVVADIALDVKGRGRYEVRQFPRGLGKSGNRNPYRMKADNGGIQRYSYCDPAFIMGTPMVEARPLSDWAAISTQNRWQGAIFAGKHDARIVPIPRPKDNLVALNQFWSVQSKGSLITQKLKQCEGGAEMIVWMSKDGLSNPVEEDGVVFVESEGAYATIRVVKGGFKWMSGTFETTQVIPENATMILNDEYAPVILEVMAKTDVKSFDAFKAKVKACVLNTVGSMLTYETVYGDLLTFDTDYKNAPSVNGEPVDYSPKKAFDSPFLNAEYNSGVGTISKGERNVVLDFNQTPDKE